MIHLFDGNNWVRRQIEVDTTGQTPRTIFYKFTNPEALTFFVWDAKDGIRARQGIFPDYKAKRPPLREDIYVGFDQVSNVLKHSAVIQVTIPGYEADDVIASMTRLYAGRGEEVRIFSNDRDFLQLMTEFQTLVTTEATIKEGVLLSDVRYHKTLVGDTSDCIPGIPGFGQAAWDKADKAELRRWVDDVVAYADPGPFPAGSKAAQTWASIPDHQLQLAKYWEIIGFLPVSDETIANNLIIGDRNYPAGDAYLRRFLQ